MAKIISMHRASDGSIFSRSTGDVSYRDVAPLSQDTGAIVPRKSNDRKAPKNAHRNSNTPIPAELMVPANDDGTPKAVTIKHLTPGQRPYIRALQDEEKDVVIATGPAGAGKTYPAVQTAIKGLREGRYKKVIITRPMVASGGEELGVLPGGIIEKVAPWCIPVLDVFKEYYSVYQVEQMLKREEIEIAPLAIMRGRTLKNAFVIGDEMQNTTIGQMKMFVTRLGENSRMVITGDTEQFDEEQLRKATGTPSHEEMVSGLHHLIGLLDAEGVPPEWSLTQMTLRDVVRHRSVSTALRLFG
ncbi:PhoH-like protein [Sphingobium phage Lacusarx]|uniref:PhoH-like protein n=1 Tax=Sphingobium phage Lacusarx TaxID=1980139 RepID=A0A1W6DWY1_9CAUD|nr:PhoH-like phosphate starvation-inducible [Sphingobium phage Lacusarx]ARK07401.1 PhoH-like protein [Sphingobium phage Lacusarx]